MQKISVRHPDHLNKKQEENEATKDAVGGSETEYEKERIAEELNRKKERMRKKKEKREAERKKQEEAKLREEEERQRLAKQEEDRLK